METSYFRPLAAEIAAPTTVGASTNVGKAQNVRIVNSHATAASLVSLMDTDGSTTLGTMTLAAGERLILNKGKEEELWAAAATVKFVKCAR
jgi:hypothetical protein